MAGGTSNGITVNVPASVTTAYALTLPPAAPTTNGQALTALTTGVASWTSVCLPDGTNCPSSGINSLRLAFTRAKAATNATLATKDALCVAEFGSNYRTAALADAAANYPKSAFSGSYTDEFHYNFNNDAVIGLSTTTNSQLVTSDGKYCYRNMNDINCSDTTSNPGVQEVVYSDAAHLNATYPIACLKVSGY